MITYQFVWGYIMSRLKIRSWSFAENEEVQLYWHGVPFVNTEGLWMLKCLFKRSDGSFKEQITPFGTLPYLRNGQTYINGEFSDRPGSGSIHEIKLPGFVKLDYCKAFNFPKRLYAFDIPPAPAYGNLPLCRFEIGGNFYYIPCTEIVRSILAPYKMLVNQILRPEGLECFIENHTESGGRLSVYLSEEYDRKLLNDDAISYFIWLRFNKQAQRSWNSVYRNIIIDASKKSNDISSELRKGIPIRVMPAHSGASTWTFRGLQYKNHYLILELLHRSDLEIPFYIVECFHPKLERLEADGKPRYVKDPTKKPLDSENLELDTTGEAAEKHTNNNIIEQPPVMYSFKNKPRIYRKSNKKRKVHTGDVIVIGTGKDSENNNVGTTQDWVLGGSIPQLEFDGLKMVDMSICKGLEEFFRLIAHLQINYSNFNLSFSVIPLPPLKSFSYYEDGSMRSCVIVKISREGHIPCYIIEVGRADDWSISTLVVKPMKSEFPDIRTFESFTQRLLIDLVNNSGHWDREFFRKEDKYIFETAKHISGQPIIRWAERIVEKIIS
ncbi:MAG: hypothetical protein K0R50_723 [Eubacterium sp.]|nr:hypothetical protein [Eubacterium sp.]